MMKRIKHGDYMAQCQSCGQKLGFFNKERSCGVCKKGMCSKCLKWHVLKFVNVNDPYKSEETELYVCSQKCAFEMIQQFISKIKPGTFVELLNCSHVGIEIDERLEKDPRSIYLDYMDASVNPRALESLQPKLVPIYEAVKKELENRNLEYKEDYENVI